jgi:hypothetical protein
MDKRLERNKMIKNDLRTMTPHNEVDYDLKIIANRES